MTVSMAKTIIEERKRWVLPIINKERKVVEVALLFPYGKRTLERWVAAYKKDGEQGLIPKSTKPKTQPNETSIRLKETVIALRKKERVCALKLKWKLAKQGLSIHERTVGKILKAEGLVRKYRPKKTKVPHLKVPLLPGELMEIDVKYVPKRIAGKRYYQYTAIDCATRWRYLAVYDNQTNEHSVQFLKELMIHFSYRIRAIKTDNGTIFTNWYVGLNKRSDRQQKKIHPFDVYCAEHNIIHYLIDPGKPAQNGTVERSHRSDQETFYDRTSFTTFRDLQKKLRVWNTRYNNLEHCGLNGKTPNEVLSDY